MTWSWTQKTSLAQQSQNEKSTEHERPVRPKPPKRKNNNNVSGGKNTTKESSSSSAVIPYSRPFSSTTDTVTINPADKPYVFNVSIYYH